MRVVLLAVAALAAVCHAANMNGDYAISNADGPGYSTEYTAQYFEVYSQPMQTRYSEVYWTMQEAVPLPPEIVKQFANATMAVVGYEADQVYRTSNGDVSVPIYWSYNHHYEAYLMGAYAQMYEMPKMTGAMSSYGNVKNHGSRWRAISVRDDPRPDSNIPTSQFFSETNGGEYRKSYKGYPTGYAQLIDSPVSFMIQPMQIDTHNRNYSGPGFKPGPLPRSSAAPPNAIYSGLLECPCTTRLSRNITVTYATQNSGTCTTPVTNASECFYAATTIGVPAANIIANQTASSPDYPNGCALVPNGKGQYTVVLNTQPPGAGADCGGSSSGQAPHVRGTLALPYVATVTVELNATASGDGSQGIATVTLSGPDGVWFGVGFNASAMADLPYVIVVNGTGGVEEHRIADHAPGNLLAPTVTLVSNTVRNGVRTTVVQRAMQGAGSDYYNFNAVSRTNIPVIMAVGNTPNFAYHQNKSAGNLVLTSVDAPSCICDVGESGSIGGLPFKKNCLPEPQGDLIQQKNPTCSIKTYQGGLSCCHHQWFLLDADQEIPAPVDTTYLKFRFYYEVYDPKKHQNLIRLYYQTEAWAGEYDIVKAPAGTRPEDTVQTLTARFQVKDMINPCNIRHDPQCTGQPSQGIELIYVSGHCHAPTCLSMELYNADTGDLLCGIVPTFGNGTEIYNEKGYLLLPPCLFAHNQTGLLQPTFLGLETNLLSIKKNNNTYSHYGEMASWQMRGIPI